MDSVLEDATYVDNQLGNRFYKRHLLATYKNFQMVRLSKRLSVSTTISTLQNLTE